MQTTSHPTTIPFTARDPERYRQSVQWWPTCFRYFFPPVDVSKYGLIYGGAQKNLAPAGVALL
jgi:hypothetical protein